MHGRHNLHFKVAAAYIFIEGRMQQQSEPGRQKFPASHALNCSRDV